MTDIEVIKNHERYIERVTLFQQYGYDIEEARYFIIRKARPLSGRILEAGTGKGYFSLALAREGFNFTTCDISADEQRYAGLNLAYYGLIDHVCFDVADLECLPYPDASYDMIFAVNMVHHLSSVEPACSEMVRVLSPVGKIVLADFNEKGLAVMDQIHMLDGRRHDVGAATITEAGVILSQQCLAIEEHAGIHQDVLVAGRKT